MVRGFQTSGHLDIYDIILFIKRTLLQFIHRTPILYIIL